MSYILKQEGKTPNIPFKHFICDTVDDMSKIDLNGIINEVPMGSTCYIINTGDIYYLNSKKGWIKKPSNGNSGGSSGPDIDPADVIVYDGGDVYGN